MKKQFRVLVIDDEATIRDLIKGRLERRGHFVATASEGAEAIKLAKSFNAQVAVTDLRMPGLDGFEVLAALKIPTILITGHGDKESAIRAVELGAFAFFEKPFDLDALEVAVIRAGERHGMEVERAELLQKLEKLCNYQNRELEVFDSKDKSAFVGESIKIQEIKEILKRLAVKPNSTMLVLGETGTGKEVIAKELHRLTYSNSQRVPFLALNCASIPTELFESELYGHEKGSFSGAHAARVGLAEAVREGTLFLDEIGEMDPRHQAKLLRLLQEKVFRRVGSNTELPFQGRIIAATHRNLKSLSASGAFREDLYYRLSVVTIEAPPLRERGADILTLAETLCQRHGMKSLSPERVAELQTYNWPGNIRELNNWIERAAILGWHDDKNQVTAPVPSDEVTSTATPNTLTTSNLRDIKSLRAELLENYDRRWILEALDKHSWSISGAAKELGLDRKNLSKRMKDLEIQISKKAA